jgi:hypothetical protein
MVAPTAAREYGLAGQRGRGRRGREVVVLAV